MKKLILIFIVIPTFAFAQQPQSLAIDRISFSLGQCIKSAEEITDKLNTTQIQLVQAQAEIKRLKEKYEPNNNEKKQ